MKTHDVYLYGMILLSNTFLLKRDYPKPDTYEEFTKRYSLPGGETAIAATILASYGCNVFLEGAYLGNRTYSQIIDFYKDKTVDTSKLYFDSSYDGLEDVVLIDKNSRTILGTFEDYYSNGTNRWNDPEQADIVNAKVVGVDPWFGDKTNKVVSICKDHNIPYVVIDCAYDSYAHKYSGVNVISNEFLSMNYPDADRDELFKKYIENSNGLVIFTLGARDILYGRKGQDDLPKHFKPYHVKVVSTLGAGDSFRAGCIYGVLQNWNDEEIVRFAAATAASACTAFPIPLNPPTLSKINDIIGVQP